MNSVLFTEMVSTFTEEMHEYLDSFARGLCALDTAPGDASALELAREAAWSVKSAAATLAVRAEETDVARRLKAVSTLARVAEVRVAEAIRGSRPLDSTVLDRMSRIIPMIYAVVDSNLNFGGEEIPQLIEELHASTNPRETLSDRRGLTQDDLDALFDADIRVRAVDASDEPPTEPPKLPIRGRSRGGAVPSTKSKSGSYGDPILDAIAFIIGERNENTIEAPKNNEGSTVESDDTDTLTELVGLEADAAVNDRAAREPRASAGEDSLSELHRVFLEEARETLETLGRNIIDLERDAHNTDTVNSALRLAHTLKGSAAMVGFDRVRVLSHAMEDTLQAVRDGRVDLTEDMTDMLLGALDVLARYVAAIGETGTEPSDSRSNEAVQRLRGFAETPSPPTSTIQQDPTSSDSPADVGGPLAEPDVVESEDEISEECIEEEITPEDFPRWSHDVFVELIRSLVALDRDASNTVMRGHFAVTAKRLAHGAELSGYDKIDDLASALAQLMRDGDSREPVSDDLLDVLNAGVDALGMALVRVRRDGHDRDPAVDEVTSLLSTVDPGDPRAEASDASDNGTAKNDERRGRSRTVEVDLDRLNRLLSLAAELVIVPNRLSAELERVVERIVRMTNGYATRSDRPEPSEQSQAVGLDAVPQTSDVNSTRRDGDWELAEITESIGEFGDATANLDQDIGRINTIAKDLHDEILRVRMVRVERAFDRIPLIIRDAARSENKRVNLVLEGADTEIDKNILEAMNNPLLHLIRNTVGHGIETPEERIAVGKPPIGEVRVKAEQDGNRIIVEVSDDGRGIDPDRIRSTAVRRELLTSEEAKSLTDAEVINLIFRPGFTTVEAVNELSGRGVGLDVVRSVATRFNGSVIVESTVGRGTVFRVTLPLTLAIGQALLVEVCGTVFALPLPAVDRIERVSKSDIEDADGMRYLRSDATRIPIFSLAYALGLRSERAKENDEETLVITREHDVAGALVVDRIVGRDDIVIKTLGRHLRRVRGVSGATILGDGSIALILNTHDLLNDGCSKPIPGSESPERIADDDRNNAAAERSTVSQKPRSVLVVDDAPTLRTYISEVLKRAGYDVTTATDGADALEKLREVAVDLVISDLEMPRMNGDELVVEIKKREDMRTLPVILLTAQTDAKHRRAAAALGVAGYLTKPFDEARLLRAVSELVVS